MIDLYRRYVYLWEVWWIGYVVCVWYVYMGIALLLVRDDRSTTRERSECLLTLTFPGFASRCAFVFDFAFDFLSRALT